MSSVAVPGRVYTTQGTLLILQSAGIRGKRSQNNVSQLPEMRYQSRLPASLCALPSAATRCQGNGIIVFGREQRETKLFGIEFVRLTDGGGSEHIWSIRLKQRQFSAG